MWYRFWIKSGRGTDEQTYRWLEYKGMTKAEKEAEIKAEVESWCSRFACWEMGESVMRYGFNTVKLPPMEFLDERLKDAKAEIRAGRGMVRLLTKQGALARRAKKR
jgi:hypothetical protein